MNQKISLQKLPGRKKYEKHKRALIIWLAIYPLITLLYYLLGGLLQPLPMALRTFILTVVAVPVMFYVLIPGLNRLFRTWLQ